MKAFVIPETGDFMRKLLLQNVFDKFYLLEGEILSGVTWRVDGALNKDFYSEEEQSEIGARTAACWGDVKPVVYEIMKGKKLPLQFHFVLQLSEENTRWLLEKQQLQELADSLSGLYLNIRYRGHALTCTTGLSYKTFVMDKTLEQIWDSTAAQYLKQNKILIEEA